MTGIFKSDYDNRLNLLKEIVDDYLPEVIRYVNDTVGDEIVGSYRFRSRYRHKTFGHGYGMPVTGLNIYVDVGYSDFGFNSEYRYVIDFGGMPVRVQDDLYDVERGRVERDLYELGEQWISNYYKLCE